VARNQQSHTGKYLARVLNGRNGNNHGNHAAEKADAPAPNLPTE
jgi:hypothetical protein